MKLFMIRHHFKMHFRVKADQKYQESDVKFQSSKSPVAVTRFK
jgi:hypothetical protein